MKKKTAVILGAGPAGLTAAYELLARTSIKPIVIEKENYLGGLSTTMDYKGNKIDLGGHRFFTKSERVMSFWLSFLPLLNSDDVSQVAYHGKKYAIPKTKSTNRNKDEVMLIQKRLSRIYYQGTFFNYPLSFNLATILQIGLLESVLIFLSYISAEIRPRKEVSLEDFFINRFGKRLYEKFFKTYTEKVWAAKCSEMPALWGAQRVKGLSIKKAILESFRREKKETSLIERFLYPKYGPGQLWSIVEREIQKNKGQIVFNSKAVTIEQKKDMRFIVTYKSGNKTHVVQADYVFSSIPMKQLAKVLTPAPPKKTSQLISGLPYRDFIVVGLLFKKLKMDLKDTWLYIHDPEVKVGRIQIFNNWSEALVKNQDTMWIGMEYFCNEGDNFWNKHDKEIINISIRELVKLNLASKKDFLDGVVKRVYKAYPAYTGTYSEFETIKSYFNSIENLFLIGRNGMHKYNNQDHSMLTAMTSVDNIIKGKKDNSNVWEVNTEEDYHEGK